MNYEEKYKEALERARALIEANTSDALFHLKDIESIFPDLVECEEERIRKAIIEHLRQDIELGQILSEEEGRDWIAWLEKQGDQNLIMANSPQLDEPKPTDKVRPKFQNGQWIVWQNKCYKVNYDGCGYELIDQNGLSTSLEYGTIDESAHLWDVVKDAKDGDVLTYYLDKGKVLIFIYEGLGRSFDEEVKVHAELDRDGYFSGSTAGICCKFMDLLTPATKEQHDLLFQKMKEAGYEWEADKKELKKIEKKPADKIKPKFNVGDVMRTSQEANDNVTGGLPIVVVVGNEYYHCTNELIAIKDQDDYEYPPMNRRQESTDKIELKLKIKKGKWYICIKELSDKYGNVIVFSKGSTYHSTKDDTLIPENSNVPFEIKYCVNDYFRLWTIEDAKEGEVLVDDIDETPFIFNGLLDQTHPNCPVAYCGIDSGYNFIATRDDSWWTCRDVKPATKEQQDYLFRKMRKAGYIWEGHTKKLVCE